MISPKDSIGDTLIEYEEDLGNLETQINNLPIWINSVYSLITFIA